MGLKTEKGIQFKISEIWFNIKENCLYSDIYDIKYGIKTLSKKGFFQKLYFSQLNSSYTIDQNIIIMKLLIKQKKELIVMRRKHRKQMHDLNVKFNIEAGIWDKDPHPDKFIIPKLF